MGDGSPDTVGQGDFMAKYGDWQSWVPGKSNLTRRRNRWFDAEGSLTYNSSYAGAQRKYNVHYADGSAAEGFVGADVVRLGGITIPNQVCFKCSIHQFKTIS